MSPKYHPKLIPRKVSNVIKNSSANYPAFFGKSSASQWLAWQAYISIGAVLSNLVVGMPVGMCTWPGKPLGRKGLSTTCRRSCKGVRKNTYKEEPRWIQGALGKVGIISSSPFRLGKPALWLSGGRRHHNHRRSATSAAHLDEGEA